MAQVLAWLSDLPVWSYYLIFGILSLLLARKSQVDAWVEANPRIGGLMKLLRGAGLDPWIIVQGVCLIVFKRLPEKPVLGYKPKLPPGLGTLLFIGVLMAAGLRGGALLVSGCASVPPPVKAQVIESAKAIAYAEAVIALELLDQAEADKLDAIQSPTEAQIVAARARVAQLVLARDLLKEARLWIMGESDADGAGAIQRAAVVLRDVVKAIKAEGGDVPPVVETALEFVR